MYQPRTPGYHSQDQVTRWALPDRVFFACGACHILAHAFLERYGAPQHEVTWIRPVPGYWGNHIIVGTTDWVFDFHGYSRREAFFVHAWKRNRWLWPGWEATLVPLPSEVLISGMRSQEFDRRLKLRAPQQFLHDALPRARRYLERFPAPDAIVR
ncbi:hypothetical protein [Reyranella soli]|uniref:Uncharacterized protein n=1 Tax=Reyranella soli TaxID=1230389 RepID=A0A512N5Q2_9HYPH|nr:hypothetical protein [Reyranella soli]GEP54306.1 hypothetical protein RSO01_14720 [Reyranella soli]